MYEEDRKNNLLNPDPNHYWREIPGTNFYIASDKIVTLNIAYNLESKDLMDVLRNALSKISSQTKFAVTINKQLSSKKPSEKKP